MNRKLWTWKLVAVFGWDNTNGKPGYRTAHKKCRVVADSYESAIYVMQQWWRTTVSDAHDETGEPINWQLYEVVELKRGQEVVTGDQVAKYWEEVING